MAEGEKKRRKDRVVRPVILPVLLSSAVSWIAAVLFSFVAGGWGT